MAILFVLIFLMMMLISKKVFASEKLVTFFGKLTAIMLLFVLYLAIQLGTSYTIEEQIRLYNEENTKIQEYMNDYSIESGDTFWERMQEYANENKVLRENMNVITKNQKKIRKLLEKEANLPNIKWELYFGR